MIDMFQSLRPLVPEFADEALFRGFLVAFGCHVRRTLDGDSGNRPVTHWWNGPTLGSDSMFYDSSRGGCRAVFNEAGRLRLALYLAEQTFVSLEQFFAAGVHARFLENPALLVGRDYLNAYLEVPKGSLEEELLTVPSLAPQFALPEALVKARKRKQHSETMLAKRKPEIQLIAPNRPISEAERSALRRSQMAEGQKQARREKEAARKKALRLQQKVGLGIRQA